MRYPYNSLTFKLFIICLAFVFGTVIILYQMSYRVIEREVRANNDFYIDQMQSKVDQYISLSAASLDTILFAVESTFSDRTPDDEEVLSVLRHLYDLNAGLLANVYMIYEDASMIGGGPRSVLFNEPNDRRREIVTEAIANKSSVYVSRPYRSKQQDWTVTMAKYIAGSNPLRIAALDIDLKEMESTLLTINRSDLLGIAIVDSEGTLVAGNLSNIAVMDSDTRTFAFGDVTSRQLLSQSTISGVLHSEAPERDWYYRKFPGSRFNWTIMSFYTDSLLQKSLERTKDYNFTMLGIGLVLSALTAAFITRYIRRPLYVLISKMRLVKQGFFDIPVVLKRKDEFGELSLAFDSMLRQIAELLDQVKRSHELQHEQEIQVLQSQINPHFLYNTLGAISNAVNLGYLDKVDPIIRSLIRILEYGVANDSRFVPLSDELDNVREYLFIQNVRYNSQYGLIESIEHGLDKFTVFRLLLQPIVENSLFHGYSGGRVHGSIEVRAYRSEGLVVIEVIDSGAGMSEELAARLLDPADSLSTSNTRSRKRIGLRNIHQRIQLYYGEAYGLVIESRVGQGTSVKAIFPNAVEGLRIGGE